MHGTKCTHWAGKGRAFTSDPSSGGYVSPGHPPWQLWRSAASCMPGPHSHTNPPSVFTHWPSQDELKHSSMSGKREDSSAQTTLNVAGCRERLSLTGTLPAQGARLQPGSPTRGRKTRPQEGHRPSGNLQKAEAKGPGSFSVTHADRMTDTMPEIEPFSTAAAQSDPRRAEESEQEG